METQITEPKAGYTEEDHLSKFLMDKECRLSITCSNIKKLEDSKEFTQYQFDLIKVTSDESKIIYTFYKRFSQVFDFQKSVIDKYQYQPIELSKWGKSTDLSMVAKRIDLLANCLQRMLNNDKVRESEEFLCFIHG